MASMLRRRQRFYSLAMFPYPSGALHAGHLRVYTISDTLARFQRSRGKDVLHPMGWDSFGLPAENAAIERGIEPRHWTEQNIQSMREELDALGASFDWDRSFATSDASYYGRTQSLFQVFLRHGLAYRGEAEVWWDPVDKTVLANEQVDDEGLAWRSGAVAERKLLKQWFVRTTAYAGALDSQIREALDWKQQQRERASARMKQAAEAVREATAGSQGLPDGLSFGDAVKAEADRLLEAELPSSEPQPALAQWPDEVLLMQQAWIGQEDVLAAEGSVSVSSTDDDAAAEQTVTVDCVARCDKLRDGRIACAAVDPLHPLARALTAHQQDPSRGVVGEVQLSLPAGLERGTLSVDGEAVRVPLVIVPGLGETAVRVGGRVEGPLEPEDLQHQVRLAESVELMDLARLQEACGNDEELLSRLTLLPAQADADKPTGLPRTGAEVPRYRMRDWLVSRQRAWGTPVPVVYCHGDCGPQPAPLPVLLPEGVLQQQPSQPSQSSSLTDDHGEEDVGGSPLALAPEEWHSCTCPKCGGSASRDVHTLDTFVDSSWYFHRFPDPTFEGPFGEDEAAATWSPVDVYVGGIEHATTHLLYARFVHEVLVREAGLRPSSIDASSNASTPRTAPFERLVTQGMVLGLTWTAEPSGRHVTCPKQRASLAAASNEGQRTRVEADAVAGDVPPGTTHFKCRWEKMSKSKGNGVQAGELLREHGADAARLLVLFLAPPHKPVQWSDGQLAGVRRWLSRVRALVADSTASSGSGELDAAVVDAVRTTHARVTAALSDTLAFNVAIAELMKLTNTVANARQGLTAATHAWAVAALLRMLAPMAPDEPAQWFTDLTHSDVHSEPWELSPPPHYPSSDDRQ